MKESILTILYEMALQEDSSDFNDILAEFYRIVDNPIVNGHTISIQYKTHVMSLIIDPTKITQKIIATVDKIDGWEFLFMKWKLYHNTEGWPIKIVKTNSLTSYEVKCLQLVLNQLRK